MMFKRKLCYFLFLLTNRFNIFFPTKLRGLFVQGFLKKKIKNLIIQSNVHIYGYRRLKIGNDVSINHGCFISCNGGISIGNFVSIGANTTILSTEHSYNDKAIPIKYQPIQKKPTEIGNDVWIGTNVTILAGVNIPDGTIVAAGAVVNKSPVNKNTIIGGVPAKFLKRRFYARQSHLNL